MSATAIIVAFALNTSSAVFCTSPIPLEQAQAQVSAIDVVAWKRAHPGLTPPNIIIRGQPNYNDALNGKIVDDPTTGTSTTVPPCAPLPLQ